MNPDTELNFTGERLMTEIYEYWSIEHLHRYALTLNLIAHKKVIDIASGEGYGSNILADYAQEVIGIDISEKAVKHAEKKYKKSNLSYLQGSASSIPLDDNSIDVVISFETIEHHVEHDKMMQEIIRVLMPGGLLIISSPDKKNYSDIPKYNNPFHVKELYADEFEKLLKKYFKNVLMFNQKTVVGSFISSAQPVNNAFIEFSGGYSNINRFNQMQNAPYNIIVASNISLVDFPVIQHSVFSNQDMFEDYTKLKSENERLQSINIELTNKLKRPLQQLIRMIEFPLRTIKRIFIS